MIEIPRISKDMSELERKAFDSMMFWVSGQIDTEYFDYSHLFEGYCAMDDEYQFGHKVRHGDVSNWFNELNNMMITSFLHEGKKYDIYLFSKRNIALEVEGIEGRHIEVFEDDGSVPIQYSFNFFFCESAQSYQELEKDKKGDRAIQRAVSKMRSRDPFKIVLDAFLNMATKSSPAMLPDPFTPIGNLKMMRELEVVITQQNLYMAKHARQALSSNTMKRQNRIETEAIEELLNIFPA